MEIFARLPYNELVLNSELKETIGLPNFSSCRSTRKNAFSAGGLGIHK